ncbi:MAG: hypothetical protein LBI82_12295 [Dysgonamonadaceae bacterium]|jgi:hypothetical protein|nr:hypothetical protein [Dysgonamonadaceae bacterium]
MNRHGRQIIKILLPVSFFMNISEQVEKKETKNPLKTFSPNFFGKGTGNPAQEARSGTEAFPANNLHTFG